MREGAPLQQLIGTLIEARDTLQRFARCVEITPDEVRGWLAGDEDLTVEEGGYPPHPDWELVKDVDDDLLAEAIALFCAGADEVNVFKERAAHRIVKDYIGYARSRRTCDF